MQGLHVNKFTPMKRQVLKSGSHMMVPCQNNLNNIIFPRHLNEVACILFIDILSVADLYPEIKYPR